MTTTVPIALAEQAEINAYADFVTGAPAPLREMLGVGSLELGGSARAIAIRDEPSTFFNRAGGFGASSPIDGELVARVLDFYRGQGVPLGRFMIAPRALPSDWASIVERFALTESTRYVKLGCDIETVMSRVGSALDPGLRIGPVEPRHAPEWAEVMTTTFGLTTPGMAEMARACVGRRDWRQFAVWAGERIVAVGSIFVNGECADMFGGATVEQWRGRGAQSALLAARVRAAQDAGCRWLVAETGAEKPGDRNTSLRNMLNIGFEPLYERVTWVCHP